ncbi:MAG: O-antigen ligase family protein [Clostridia bacterium]|nr:O-antigen ligase family protein [Clostridia bacterium]
MKKINLEKLLLIFIAILPILDMSSFLFRNYFNTNFSISTFIRPIIPIIIIVIIFFKNKFKLKTILIGLIYFIYAIIHLHFFNKLKLGISFGTITHEAQYLINYTFAILNLFIFLFVFYKKENKNKNINKIILITNGIYILSLYISIFTKTSSSTYIEGMGFKGWFESGNSISAILILNLFIVFTLFNKVENIKIKILAIIEIILSGIFLTFLLGTRTGLYGFVLVIGLYICSKLFILFRDIIANKNKKINKKNKILLIASSCLVICVICIVIFKGSSLLTRRKYLEQIESNIYDSQTGEPSHVTGDILKFKEDIENNKIDETYISKPMQTSIIELYNYANNHEISNTDRRTQQLIFNTYLVKNQSNIFYILFGNGFLNNYGELILEMEIPALLFNFGLIGFILYFIPFFALFIYYIYIGFKNIKIIDTEYVLLISGIAISFVLSLLLGQLFFNSSASIIIVCMNVLLYNKCVEIKSYTVDIDKNLKTKEPVTI